MDNPSEESQKQNRGMIIMENKKDFRRLSFWKPFLWLLVIVGGAGMIFTTYSAVDIYARNLIIADQIQALKVTKDELDAEIKRLNATRQETAEALKKVSQEHATVSGKLTEVTTELARVTQEKVQTEAMVMKLKTSVEGLTTDRTQLDQTLQALRTEYKTVGEDLNRMKSNREVLRPLSLRYEAVKRDCSSAEARRRELNEGIDRLTKRTSELDGRYQQVQTDFSELNGQVNTARLELSTLRNNVRSAKSEVTQLEAQQGNLKKQVAELSAQAQAQNSAIAVAEKTLQDLTSRIKRASEADGILTNFSQKLDQVDALAQKYSTNAAAAETVSAALADKAREVTGAVKDMVAVMTDLRKQAQGLSRANTDLGNHSVAFAKRTKELEDQAVQLDGLLQTLRADRMNMAEVNDQVVAVMKVLEKMTQFMEPLSAAVHDLQGMVKEGGSSATSPARRENP